jgi:hypothetical protein
LLLRTGAAGSRLLQLQLLRVLHVPVPCLPACGGWLLLLLRHPKRLLHVGN